jgi:hypothetical protein
MTCRRQAAQNGLVDVDAFIRDGYVVIRGAFDVDRSSMPCGDLGLDGRAGNPRG